MWWLTWVALASQPMRGTAPEQWTDEGPWTEPVRAAAAAATVRVEGCSGVVLSERGLVLTLRSCLEGQDLPEQGFVAASPAEERVLPGLQVSRPVREHDITRAAWQGESISMDGLAQALDGEARALAQAYTPTVTGATARATWSHAGVVRSVLESEVYEQVRLVAVAPQAAARPQWPMGSRDLALVRLLRDDQPAQTSPLTLSDAPEVGAAVLLSHVPRVTERNLPVPVLRARIAELERYAEALARRLLVLPDGSAPHQRLRQELALTLQSRLVGLRHALGVAELAASVHPVGEVVTLIEEHLAATAPLRDEVARMGWTVRDTRLVRRSQVIPAALAQLEREETGGARWLELAEGLEGLAGPDTVEMTVQCAELGVALAVAEQGATLAAALAETRLARARGPDRARALGDAVCAAWERSLWSDAQRRAAFLARPRAKALKADPFAELVLALDAVSAELAPQQAAVEARLEDLALLHAFGQLQDGYAVAPGGGGLRLSVGEVLEAPAASLPDGLGAWATPPPRYLRVALDAADGSLGAPLVDVEGALVGLAVTRPVDAPDGQTVFHTDNALIIATLHGLEALLDAVGAGWLREELAWAP